MQNALAGLGYPAPRVLYVWTGEDTVGGAFMIMERMPGRALNDAVLSPSTTIFRVSNLMADAHLALHRLDPEPVRAAVVDEGLPIDLLSVSDWLEHFARIAHESGMHGLDEGIDWLRANQPPQTGPPVVCHGDFHPLNLMLNNGKITGVIDWPWTRIAPAEYDVGAAMAIIKHGPVSLPEALAPLVDALRARLVRGYLRMYASQRPLDDMALVYYEALRTLAFLFEGGRQRLVDAGEIEYPGKPSAFRGRRQINGIGRRFKEITGIRVTLPPRVQARAAIGE